ncbi:hypothetical protein VTL71DRAFT_7186 [Oculimacula yallundae]|uniref:Uncharacterized protein n=1 Tax=Oculimacula yallundae TaxID=86028 RepID=A0ABR4BYK2_9HELO
MIFVYSKFLIHGVKTSFVLSIHPNDLMIFRQALRSSSVLCQIYITSSHIPSLARTVLISGESQNCVPASPANPSKRNIILPSLCHATL